MSNLPPLVVVSLILSWQGICSTRANGTIYTVANKGDLTAAMTNVMAGDIIAVAFDPVSLTIGGINGSSGRHIIVKADKQLARETKSITIKGCSHLTLEGFRIAGFSGNALKIVASDNLIITRNKIDFTGIAAANGIYTSGGPIHGIEISYNEFNHHIADGQWAGSYIKTWYDGSDVARGLWIHHNYFANVAPQRDAKRGTRSNPFSGDSDRETIIFGEGASQNIETEHVIESNLFENCDGEDEMVSLKTSRNIFRYNTVKNCMGSVHIRFGHASEVHGNFFIGDPLTDFGDDAYVASANYESSGVVIYGTDHRVHNNYFQNLTGGRTSKHRLPVVLDSGDTDGTTGNDHQRPRNVLITHNTFANCQHGIGVGLNYKLPPQKCTISNNVLLGAAGQLFRLGADSENDTTCTYAGNIAWAKGSANYGTDKPLTKIDPRLETVVFNGYGFSVLGDGSPAIDASVDSHIIDDIFGGTRSGKPDAGAHERGGAILRLPLTATEVGPAARN